MMKNYLYFFLCICLLLPTLTRSQSNCEIEEFANLIKDGSGVTFSSDLLYFKEFDGATYFVANETQLWKTDGTTEGTQLVMQANEDNYPDAFLTYLVVVGDSFYFTEKLSTRSESAFLWKSDGTSAGTVKIPLPDGFNSEPKFLTVLGDKLYFSADERTTGTELWTIDEMGNAVMAHDIYLGEARSSSPSSLTAIGNELYFNAIDGTSGSELWKIDAAGDAVMIENIAPGTRPSIPTRFTALSDQIFFTADDDTHGRELFRLDTETGVVTLTQDLNATTQANNINQDSDIQELIAFGDFLYFSANDGINGRALWKVDVAGTVSMVEDINSNSDNFERTPTEFYIFNNLLYFRADDGTNGQELWKMDASENVTLVQDINPDGDGYPFGFTILNNQLYFTADDGINGYELWKLDENESIEMVADINLSGSSLPLVHTAVGDELFFRATDAQDDTEFWKLDTDGNVVLVKDLNTITSSPNIFGITSFGSDLYFSANDEGGGLGSELWKVDENGISSLVMDINPDGDSRPSGFTAISGELYFSADDGTSGRELWKVDADGNVTQVADINPTANSNSSELTAFGDNIYFSADATGSNRELWKIDAMGNVGIAMEINPDAASNPYALTVFNNQLYFVANDGTNGSELWKIDESGNAVMVEDINPTGDGRPFDFNILGDELFFTATNDAGSQLCKLDAEGNVILLKDSNPDIGSDPQSLTVVGDQLFFTARGTTSGLELWKIDASGSASIVKDIHPTSSSVPNNLIAVGNQLFFVANDGESGRELWNVDATGNTALVKDINLSSNASIDDLVAVGDQLYFTAREGAFASPTELWTSNGTTAGTVKVSNAIGSESADRLTVINSQLYFLANTPEANGLLLTVACGLPCTISDVSIANSSECMEGAISSTFTTDITVTFADAPTTGTLDLTGDGTASVDVSELSETTYTFTGVVMPADGERINLTATFSAATDCSFTPKLSDEAPADCSCDVLTTSNIAVFQGSEAKIWGDDEGILYAVLPNQRQVYQIDLNNENEQTLLVSITEASFIQDIWGDGEGNLYVSSDSNIYTIDLNDTNYSYTTSAPVGGNITGIWNDKMNNLYISDNGGGENFQGSVSKYNAQTMDIERNIVTGLSGPRGIWGDDQGSLYIAELYTDKILKVDLSNNTFTALVTEGIEEPEGIWGDGKGNLFFTSENKLMKIDLNNANAVSMVYTYENTSELRISELWGDKNSNIYLVEDGSRRESVVKKIECAVCAADLATSTAPAIGITNSTCDLGETAPTGGEFTAITCPDVSTAEYSIDNGDNWSTDLPDYNQTEAMTVLTRCKCDVEETVISITNEATTEPGVCPNPFMLSLSGNTTYMEGTGSNTTMTFTVTRKGNTGGTSTCKFGLRAYGANTISAADFVTDPFALQAVTFADGVAEQQVTLEIVGDALIEKTETFYAVIQDISIGGTYENSYLIGTITDDDDTPEGIAGADILDACGTGVTLGSGETEEENTIGMWTILAGAGGSFVDFNDYNTTFMGTTGVGYILRWTSGGINDEVSVNFAGDSDNDGVNDCEDRCPFFDDNIDSDLDGAPDACDCDPQSDDDAMIILPDDTMVDGFIPSGMYDGSGTIVSTGTVADGSDVTYKAAVSITLNAGFSVEAGAVFNAYIAPCTFDPDYQAPVCFNCGDENTVTERFTEPNTTTDLPTTFQVTVQPNPARDLVQIGFELATDTPVSMDVFSAMGERIAAPLQQQVRPAGKHLHGLNVSQLTPGLYYVRVQTKDAQQIVKVMIQR